MKKAHPRPPSGAASLVQGQVPGDHRAWQRIGSRPKAAGEGWRDPALTFPPPRSESGQLSRREICECSGDRADLSVPPEKHNCPGTAALQFGGDCPGLAGEGAWPGIRSRMMVCILLRRVSRKGEESPSAYPRRPSHRGAGSGLGGGRNRGLELDLPPGRGSGSVLNSHGYCSGASWEWQMTSSLLTRCSAECRDTAGGDEAGVPGSTGSERPRISR